jgi:hypothetical protein
LESARVQSEANDGDNAATQSLEPLQSQGTLQSSTSTTMGSSFIGPLLPGYSDAPRNGDDELPSFEQSQDDSVTIPIRIDEEAAPQDRLAPSPSSSLEADASSVRAEASDSEEDGRPWIRRAGSGEWSPTYRSGVIRRLSDASDMETFGYNTAPDEATIDIDISTPPHSVE